MNLMVSNLFSFQDWADCAFHKIKIINSTSFASKYAPPFPGYACAILFNSIPKNLRNMSNCPVTTFKRQLDRYLSIIPDEPDIHGYTACKNATSNSIAKLSSTVRDFQLEEGRSGLQADISLFT